MLTQIVCPHGRIQTHIRKAVFTTLFLSGMSAIFGQDKISEKNTLQKNTTTTLPTDSVDIAGFRVSQDEAKIYENFLSDRAQYGSEQQMTSNYKKRITMNRRKKQLEEELAAAKREEARLDQAIVEADSRIESKKQAIVEADSRIESKKQVIVEAESRIEGKKQVIVEKDKTIKQLKQQLFQAREKKLGRALTEKEKQQIVQNI